MIISILNSIGKKYKQKRHLYKPLLWFILIAFSLYLSILITFASLFQGTEELCFTYKNLTVTSFWDCFYFSCITFHTIGYGDIIPDGEYSKMYVEILSFISLLFVILFSGYSVHLFIKAENEVKKIRIRNITLQHLLQITDDFTSKFIPEKFRNKEKKIINIYYDKYTSIVVNIKEDSNLSDIMSEIKRKIEKYIYCLKDSGQNENVHMLVVKEMDQYFEYTGNYLKDLKEGKRDYLEYLDDEISIKMYDVIEKLEKFDYYYKIKSQTSKSVFEKYEKIYYPISKIIEEAIELQMELVSMSKPIKDKIN